ncbi:MAG TPA: amino acid ABC transporter permease, partial [Rhizobiales bacterium]|nr:amino acid ABC transporter permease [Hyphomicrobiales bacterium]
MDWIVEVYNYRVVAQFIPEFTRGIAATIWISLLSLIMALIIGTFVA